MINQENTIDAVKFSYLENITLREELYQEIIHPNFYNFILKYWAIFTRDKYIKLIKKLYLSIIKWLSTVSNYSLLFLNRISNRHGTSYFRSIIFTFSVGIFFYYLSMISSTKYSFNNEINWGIFKQNISTYFQFMIPTHQFKYLGNDFMRDYVETPNRYEFYFFDILGRIFIGYGIYQTIQAFRKYKSK